MSRRAVLVVIALALVLAIGVDSVALAANAAHSTSDIGKNVGGQVTDWAKGLLLGVAALVGLPALFRRDVGQGLVIVLIVVLVGGFVYAGGPVQDTIRSIWQDVAGPGTTDAFVGH